MLEIIGSYCCLFHLLLLCLITEWCVCRNVTAQRNLYCLLINLSPELQQSPGSLILRVAEVINRSIFNKLVPALYTRLSYHASLSNCVTKLSKCCSPEITLQMFWTFYRHSVKGRSHKKRLQFVFYNVKNKRGINWRIHKRGKHNVSMPSQALSRATEVKIYAKYFKVRSLFSQIASGPFN